VSGRREEGEGRKLKGNEGGGRAEGVVSGKGGRLEEDGRAGGREGGRAEGRKGGRAEVSGRAERGG
jgi:hypothetical protein